MKLKKTFARKSKAQKAAIIAGLILLLPWWALFFLIASVMDWLTEPL